MPSPLAAPVHVVERPARDAVAHTVAQAGLLLLLFTVPALIGLRMLRVDDPDVWWHLRSGEWVTLHRAVPHSDLFSIFGAGRPWQAYSWLFEVLIFQLFRHLGLFGLMVYVAGGVLAITVACYQLVRRLTDDFSIVALLTFAVCFSCGHLYTPRPWLLSILFFVLEMNILMHARRVGSRRELLWLPVIFMVWANVHIQFVDGLLVLGLAWGESLLARWHRGVETKLGLRSATLVSILCLGVTLCNPYGWHIFQVAFQLTAQPGVLDKIQELQALPFRDATDWCVLGLAMGAVAAVARSGRSLCFEAGILSVAMYLSFRSQRDVWILAVSSVAILASATSPGRVSTKRMPGWLTPMLAAAAVVLIGIYSLQLQFDRQHLATRLAETLPVRAVAFVREHQYAGPVYNDYGWGGYLIWSLRQPVTIDGRAAFYGDQRIDRSIATWSGRSDWSTDPDLRAAHLIVGPVQTPLVQLLRLDPSVKLVYEDSLAAVFVRP